MGALQFTQYKGALVAVANSHVFTIKPIRHYGPYQGNITSTVDGTSLLDDEFETEDEAGVILQWYYDNEMRST